MSALLHPLRVGGKDSIKSAISLLQVHARIGLQVAFAEEHLDAVAAVDHQREEHQPLAIELPDGLGDIGILKSRVEGVLTACIHIGHGGGRSLWETERSLFGHHIESLAACGGKAVGHPIVVGTQLNAPASTEVEGKALILFTNRCGTVERRGYRLVAAALAGTNQARCRSTPYGAVAQGHGERRGGDGLVSIVSHLVGNLTAYTDCTL